MRGFPIPFFVIPAEAGLHTLCGCGSFGGSENMDSRVRGNDGVVA
jgi:hypothetical protein